MPSPPQDAIGFQLLTSARLMRAQFERELTSARLDLMPSDARALVVLGVVGPIRQSALAEMLTVEPMTLKGTLDRLEARGLVTRQPDGRDGRAKLVSLRPEAVPLHEKVLAVLAETRRHALRRFSAEDAETLRVLLKRLSEDLVADAEAPR